MRSVVPFVLLVGYGVAFGVASLGGGLLVFDDHPGQLYRVWHVVTRGWAPWAWNPGWWAGYPELQFYPPGFAYAAALLHVISSGALTVPAAYQTMLWAAYLAPGVTAFLLLARVLGNGWLALPGAFVALTLSAGVASGVEGGVRWGMVPARLGWALLPLLALVLVRWSERRGRFPAAAVPLLAAIVLLHPAHLPAAVAIVALATLAVGPTTRGRSAVVALIVAAAWTAFWTLPLLVRLDNARPLAWGALSARETLSQPLALVVVGLSIVALVRGHHAPAPGTGGQGSTLGGTIVTRWPWITLLIVVVDALVVERLGIRWLPAHRVADGAWLAFVLAAGIGAGHALAWATGRARVPLPALSLATIAVLVVLSLPGRSLALWPRATDWPTHASTSRGLRLPELWSTLRALPDGRVLFVRSGVPLVFGTAWYRAHTHITSLAPVAADRPIVHGTFTHPSPLAAIVYRGIDGRGAITRLAEELDGHSLFGRPLDELDGAALRRYADRWGLVALVAIDEDLPALRTLVRDSDFDRPLMSPPFVVHSRRSPVDLPREIEPGRWRMPLAGAAGTWVSARLSYYPLWRAEHDGRAIPVRRGALGDLEVKLPADRATLDLIYTPAVAEYAGLAVSVLGLLAWLSLTLRSWRNPPGGGSEEGAAPLRDQTSGS